MDVTVKWHPKDSSIFFCSSGDKLHVRPQFINYIDSIRTKYLF